jgi:hypothetical protein
VTPVPKESRACKVHMENKAQLELKDFKAKLAHQEQTAFKVRPVRREMRVRKDHRGQLAYREPKVMQV